MFDLIEKISHGVCGAIVLLVGVLYAFNETPTTIPREFLRGATISSAPPPPSTAAVKRAEAEGKPAPVAPTTAALRQEDTVIRKALRDNGARVGSLKREWATVPRSDFEVVRNKSNWAPELNLARSRPIQTRNGPTRLELTKIPPNSYLAKVAQLEAGDIVELIDGQPLEYNNTSTAKFWSLADELFDRLESGGEISLTVTRGSETIHRVFRVGDR